jgi:predicted RNA-binding Zn-ribbon protein involved in translation (DUF1610 family)
MSTAYVYDEKANSKDLTDEEIASALPTSCVEEIADHLGFTVCPECGEGAVVRADQKRFRFPHFYWRSLMKCDGGHAFQKVFQVTWLYKPTT